MWKVEDKNSSEYNVRSHFSDINDAACVSLCPKGGEFWGFGCKVLIWSKLIPSGTSSGFVHSGLNTTQDAPCWIQRQQWHLGSCPPPPHLPGHCPQISMSGLNLPITTVFSQMFPTPHPLFSEDQCLCHWEEGLPGGECYGGIGATSAFSLFHFVQQHVRSE
jgi:hypothetical protein